MKQLLDNTSVQDEARARRSRPSPAARATCCSLRERGDQGPRARTSSSTTSSPTDDPDREPDRGTTEDGGDQAKQFVDYRWTEEAQQLFAEQGYRPVGSRCSRPTRDKFPEPNELFTIEKLGGWSKVDDEFFDPKNGSIVEIESELGNPTG